MCRYLFIKRPEGQWRIDSMKNLVSAFGAALVALVSFASDASAQRRCGDFIQNGTIYVASRARDCDRGTAWRRDSRGQRHWSTTNHGHAYYRSRGTVVARREFAERRASYSVATAAHRSVVATGAPAAPVHAPASSCPRITDVVPVQNSVCRRGDHQLSWRGKSNYCLGEKPSPNSYVCHNSRTGMLAWYTP